MCAPADWLERPEPFHGVRLRWILPGNQDSASLHHEMLLTLPREAGYANIVSEKLLLGLKAPIVVPMCVNYCRKWHSNDHQAGLSCTGEIPRP